MSHDITAAGPARAKVVAVTGAAGFVGAAVSAALEARGDTAVRLTRRPLAGHPDAIQWDLRAGLPAWTTLPQVDAIVHCAAEVATYDAAGTMTEAHVGGVLRLLAAWPGVAFVHVSSAAVYPGGAPGVLTEGRATGEGLQDDYARTKFAGERALADTATAEGRGFTVLRPSIIYGEGDRTVLPRARKMRIGGAVLVPGGKGEWSLTPVELLVDAILAAVDLAPAGAGVLNVAEDVPRRVGPFLAGLVEADAGRPLRRIPLPAWTMVAAAACVEGVWRVLRLRTNPVFTRSAIEYTTQDKVLDLQALRRLLGA